MAGPSVANALRLGMDLKNFAQNRDLNAEALKARRFQNALLPEERARAAESAKESAKQQKAKFGAEMVEKTLPRVLPENYAGWREVAISKWGIPERILPMPELFQGPQGLEKFKLWNGKMYEKALEIQGRKETALIAADRAKEVANINAARSKENAETSAAARIKAAEIAAERGENVANIGARSRIEAAEIRSSATKQMRPEAAAKEIVRVKQEIARLSRKPTGQVDERLATTAQAMGFNLMVGTELDPAKVADFNKAAEIYIKRMEKIANGETAAASAPGPLEVPGYDLGFGLKSGPPGGTMRPSHTKYKSPKEVQADFKAGKLNKQKAAEILIQNWPDQYK